MQMHSIDKTRRVYSEHHIRGGFYCKAFSVDYSFTLFEFAFAYAKYVGGSITLTMTQTPAGKRNRKWRARVRIATRKKAYEDGNKRQKWINKMAWKFYFIPLNSVEVSFRWSVDTTTKTSDRRRHIFVDNNDLLEYTSNVIFSCARVNVDIILPRYAIIASSKLIE